MQDDTEFVSSFPTEDLKKQYLQAKKSSIRRAKKEFKREEVELRRRLEDGIRTDREHREILNACIFPFMRDGALSLKLGYRFIRADPLYEQKVKNMDFLILKAKGAPQVIVGEAKGSITDPAEAIDGTREKIKVIETHKDYVNKNYLGGAVTPYEYVLGVNSVDSVETCKSIGRKGGGLITWHVGWSSGTKLSLAVPETKDAKLRQSVMHADNELNKALHKVETSTESFTFFLQSHKYSKLLVLTMVRKGITSDLTFTFQDVRDIVVETLPYVEPKTIDEETQNIISLGEQIEFIKKLTDGRYKIVSRHRDADGLESDLKKRWLIYQLRAKLEEKVQQAIRNVVESFELKKKKVYTLDTYSN